MVFMKGGESRKRIAVIDFDRCQPDGCGSYLCARVCPPNRAGKECIVIDESRRKPAISEELCIGCQICTLKCPFKAISIINLAQQLSQPIHSYGQNMFRLYSLPNVKNGAVVGLLGRNGTGKSTALRILSGKIPPNFGEPDSEASYGKAVKLFKGKEMQAFFEKIRDKGIKLSYKPQNVDEIPILFKGTVERFLRQFDEKGMLREIAVEMELESVLQSKISEISGGELQRAAIAACALRKAGIYFFDEPSSYLDVRQRLRVAMLIRRLVAGDSAVLVVEHDLAVLDYLSDYINVLYGTPGVYGVVSSTKSALNGVNEFLDGFLKEENMRFREKELHFSSRPPPKATERKIIAKFPALEKKFGGFSLKTSPGDFREGEVIGVLGPNAIGKTTFVKMLAGELNPDNTKLDFSLKVAYKPQYIRPKEGALVQDLFSAKGIDTQLFESEVEKKLHIKGFFDRQLSALSGGELQKVSIAYNLSLESDVILLDEPSAFIDAEDRLRVADIIRSVVDVKGKTALVIDHDILFQDYVSDRLIVFSGVPAKSGTSSAPMPMLEGMNAFLGEMGITFRRDKSTGRPRVNKLGSRLDREQKEKGAYYYTG